MTQHTADCRWRQTTRRECQYRATFHYCPHPEHACDCGTPLRRFVLERTEDITGVSGTGKVAEGVEFSDGRVALRWIVGDHRSTVLWDSLASVQAIHGHNGATTVRWLD